MKKFRFILLLSVVLFACQDDNTDGSSYVRMDINGTGWEADSNIYAILNTNNVTAIGGKKGPEVLVINLFHITSTGTYDIINSDSTDFTFMHVANGVTKLYHIGDAWPPSHGSVTITEINPGSTLHRYLKGSFSGVAYYDNQDSIVITNGAFMDMK